MARGASSTKNLHISPDQPGEKAAERGFWFEISFRIFFEDPHTTLSTEVKGLTFIRANQGVGISPGDLHAAYWVQKYLLSSICHIWVLNPTKLKTSLFWRAAWDTAQYLRIPLLTVLDHKYTNPAGQDD